MPSDHYDDVIMGAMASQITSLTIVYSTVYSDADQRKHQISASLAFVFGIHRGPVNSPHKWPVTRKMFHDVITQYISWWQRSMVSYRFIIREGDPLQRYHRHFTFTCILYYTQRIYPVTKLDFHSFTTIEIMAWGSHKYTSEYIICCTPWPTVNNFFRLWH